MQSLITAVHVQIFPLVLLFEYVLKATYISFHSKLKHNGYKCHPFCNLPYVCDGLIFKKVAFVLLIKGISLINKVDF